MNVWHGSDDFLPANGTMMAECAVVAHRSNHVCQATADRRRTVSTERPAQDGIEKG